MKLYANMRLQFVRLSRVSFTIVAMGFLVAAAQTQARELAQDLVLVERLKKQSAQYLNAQVNSQEALDPQLMVSPEDLPEFEQAELLVKNLWATFRQGRHHKDFQDAKLKSIKVSEPQKKMNRLIAAVEIEIITSNGETGTIDIAWVLTPSKKWKLIEL